MSLLTLKTLDRVKEVIIITGTEQLQFMKGEGSGDWFKDTAPFGEKIGKSKTLLQLIKKYDRAGCLVLPISEQDEQQKSFLVPDKCRQIKAYAGANEVRIARFDLKYVEDDGERIWENYETDVKYTEDEMKLYLLNRMEEYANNGRLVQMLMFSGGGNQIGGFKNNPIEKETNSL